MLCSLLEGIRKGGNSGFGDFQVFCRPISCTAKSNKSFLPPFRGKFQVIHLFRIYSSNPSHFRFLGFLPITSFRTGFLRDPDCGPLIQTKSFRPPFKVPRKCRVMLSFEPSCLGGCHITVFGVPTSRKKWDGPATIRDSSRFFTVGSKILTSSPTPQGIGFPGPLLDFRINQGNQPPRPCFNTLPKVLLPLNRLEIVVGDIQGR